MKTSYTIVFVLLFAFSLPIVAQTSPPEKKAVREYTSPAELVSISPSTPMDKAFAAIGEISNRFVGKIIIDPDRRNLPINIDIQAMQWRDALEAICRQSGIWYTEYETYIQISGGGATKETAGGNAAPGGIEREIATFRSREIKISAVFFQVNLTKLNEVGINWSFMKSTKDVAIGAEFLAADKVSSPIFGAQVTPKLSFANMDFVVKMFSDYELGDLLSSPQIIVRSGEEGRIQVGDDFSIKERDFAGNLIDKFYSAGTIIKVTPKVVNEQGVNFVHMMVDVEKSVVTPGSVSTIVTKAKATTDLLLLDGEETIIGGLYENSTSVSRIGVPFLKDLPPYVFGLRYLFGYDRDEIKKKELVILLKAELVPTLQERVTEKKDSKLFDKWRGERTQEEQRVKPKDLEQH